VIHISKTGIRGS